jgi:hypothetical protein
MPDQQPIYPTLRSQGVGDQTAYQNRIIVSVLLMMHATNDFQDGGDGGVTRGGLWLPPRLQARTAQETAAERGQAVRYPTWYGFLICCDESRTNLFRSREDAQASTPSLSANWTTSGQLPSQQPHAGSLHSRGSYGVNSAVGNLPPFSPNFTPIPQSSYGSPSAGVVYGPPSADLGGYPSHYRGAQQYLSSSSRRGEYGVPQPPNFQSQHYVQETIRAVLSPAPRALAQDSGSLPYDAATDRARNLSNHTSWQPSFYSDQREARLPPPPFEGAEHLSPFGTERTSPMRPAQAPIGSDRPQQAHHRHGVSRSSRGESARGSPGRPVPGSDGRSGCGSRREGPGWR